MTICCSYKRAGVNSPAFLLPDDQFPLVGVAVAADNVQIIVIGTQAGYIYGKLGATTSATDKRYNVLFHGALLEHRSQADKGHYRQGQPEAELVKEVHGDYPDHAEYGR